jgi:transketolase
MRSQRDVFISSLFEKAKHDKDIYLISVDMGAPSLDQWREELPEQFIAAGISEQNAINFAAGLSAAGKKVYVYFMACWVARCFEQIRYSCAMAENPITILGNGVALGYSPAGPAHNPTEDLSYMRSLCGIEIYSPSNNSMVESLVELTLKEPKLRYIRLERKHAAEMETAYQSWRFGSNAMKTGMSTVKPGLAEPRLPNRPKICMLASGYMLGRVCDVWRELISRGYQISVVDLWRVKPINQDTFKSTIEEYDILVTVEEQTLSGGFGSAILEALSDLGLKKDVLRIGLPQRYIFENGSRDYHIDNNGLSANDICEKVVKFVEKVA